MPGSDTGVPEKGVRPAVEDVVVDVEVVLVFDRITASLVGCLGAPDM